MHCSIIAYSLPPGYAGVNCTIDIDECLSNPCQHDANCTDHLAGFNCSCTTGIVMSSCTLSLTHYCITLFLYYITLYP